MAWIGEIILSNEAMKCANQTINVGLCPESSGKCA